MPGKKYFPGDKRKNNQGFEMTLIERLPNSRCIVEFNDDQKTRVECDTYSFGKGEVKNPLFKRAKGDYVESFIINRTGCVATNYENETMKVICYRSSTDIDVEFQDEYKGVVTTTWRQFKSGHVKNPNQFKTGIIHHPSNWIDLRGQTFNNLEVIEWDTNPPDTEFIKADFSGLWKCRCLLCGNYAWATGDELKSGRRKACRECGQEAKGLRKYEIKYDLSGNFGIGYTYNTNKEFYFDLEDYDKIKDISWKESSNGYVIGIKDNEELAMHRIVLGLDSNDEDKIVDHISHNTFDNRKRMLRITTMKNNLRNKSLSRNNKSGFTGVREIKDGRWEAYIWDERNIKLGTFDTFNEALTARRNAEKEHFGEYSYENSMRLGELNEQGYV